MIFAQLVSLLTTFARACFPGVPTVVLGDLARSLTMNTWFIASLASMGDLFKPQPLLYAKFSAYWQML